jgi:low temperature requirement protein LtrA
MTSSSSATGCDSPSTCPTNSSIAHPDADASLGFTILAFGGPALFLFAQLLFHHAALGRVPRSRALGLAALAILAIATAQLMLIAGIPASSAVLIAVAITDTVDEGVQAPGRSA